MTADETSTTPKTGPDARPVAPVPVGRSWSPEVIDLRGLDQLSAPPPPPPPPPKPRVVRIQIDRHVSPLESMTAMEKKRLYVRVLCELVAYGETDDAAAPALTSR
ncbi:MAG: hypothetical protein HYX32_14710 [Actinobacteria bacterium]|nr:hypothetical protein [Actinomycetota bacterium]